MSFLFITELACGGRSMQPTNPSAYLRPPATFTESDLTGTWQAEYGGTDVDTITLGSGGTYQQIFRGTGGYYYAGPPDKWWVEYRLSGCVYVHLEGMRYYASNRGLGESGGRDPTGQPFKWFLDLCESRHVQMVDKVILRVQSNPDALRGIELTQMKTSIDSSNRFFFLVSTPVPTSTYTPVSASGPDQPR